MGRQYEVTTIVRQGEPEASARGARLVVDLLATAMAILVGCGFGRLLEEFYRCCG